MQQPILVTGGTGALGRHVVDRLSGAGHDVRVTSRRPREGVENVVAADLLTGDGVDAAVDGVDTVVHCATTMNGSKDVRATETLVAAAERAGCGHLVYVSIVGVDRVPFGYYRGKLAAEQVVARGGVPYTVQRATQFHDLLRIVLAGAARLPVMPVPNLPFQPVDTGDVAVRLAELVSAEPAGRAPDMGGPEVRRLRELAGAYLAVVGKRRVVLPVRAPGRTFRAFGEGGHLAPDGATGRVTFEQYLAALGDPARLTYRTTR